MERYDSYRPSEIPCLLSVPSHWKPSKFKFHHFEEDDTVGEYSDEYPLLSLTKEGVVFRDVESGKGKFPASFENYKVVHPDRLIFCLFDIDETPRTIGLSNHFGMITGAYKLFRTTPDLNPKFSFYTFLVIDNVKGLKPYYTGLRKVVRPETFKSLEFTLPPLHEQEQIVAYLDRKTTLIDSLTEKTVRKIELLKEKRTSLINEVVTKGLNPDVEMKESGVEWIGEIPSHWSLKRLSWVASTGSGTTPKSSNDSYYSGGTINWLITGDLNDDVVLDTSKKITPKALEECRLNTYPMGSIVVAMYGATIGKLCQLGVETTVNQACCVLSSFKGILPKQVFYRILSSRDYLLFLGDGGGQPNISQEDVRSLQIPTPPLLEQEQIVEFLDEQTSIIDSTITTEEKRIELLKEYRQSLISEVVTGKVKVTRDE